MNEIVIHNIHSVGEVLAIIIPMVIFAMVVIYFPSKELDDSDSLRLLFKFGIIF